MPKPWDVRQPSQPLRETSLFRLERIHLKIIQERMAEKGHPVTLRALYRWFDSRKGRTVPKQPVASALSEVVSAMLDIDQQTVLSALLQKNRNTG